MRLGKAEAESKAAEAETENKALKSFPLDSDSFWTSLSTHKSTVAADYYRELDKRKLIEHGWDGQFGREERGLLDAVAGLHWLRARVAEINLHHKAIVSKPKKDAQGEKKKYFPAVKALCETALGFSSTIHVEDEDTTQPKPRPDLRLLQSSSVPSNTHNTRTPPNKVVDKYVGEVEAKVQLTEKGNPQGVGQCIHYGKKHNADEKEQEQQLVHTSILSDFWRVIGVQVFSVQNNLTKVKVSIPFKTAQGGRSENLMVQTPPSVRFLVEHFRVLELSQGGTPWNPCGAFDLEGTDGKEARVQSVDGVLGTTKHSLVLEGGINGSRVVLKLSPYSLDQEKSAHAMIDEKSQNCTQLVASGKVTLGEEEFNCLALTPVGKVCSNLEITDPGPMFEGILSSLESAHAVGVLHQDIKPSNMVLVHEDEESSKVPERAV